MKNNSLLDPTLLAFVRPAFASTVGKLHMHCDERYGSMLG